MPLGIYTEKRFIFFKRLDSSFNLGEGWKLNSCIDFYMYVHKEVEETVPAASNIVTPAPEILPPAFQNTQEMSS